VLKALAVSIMAGILLACASAYAGAQSSAHPALHGTEQQPRLSPIGIDYAPETRCSDNNPDWLSAQRPVACNPQLGVHGCGDTLNTCPARCDQCYSDDLSLIRRELKVNTITIYAPNYHILKAAQRLGMKVILGLYNDAVLGLAMPASQANCSSGGTALYLCGSKYASALIDGACSDRSGGDPFALCVSRCSIRSDPARDCKNGDCSCNSDAECLGAANQCRRGAHIAPLNNSLSGEFLRDGTVAVIQLGNEFMGQCQIPEVPGQHQPCCDRDRTGKCRAWIVNRQVISTAAQTLRRALDQRGLNKIKISYGLSDGSETEFCRDGAPPPGIDYVAAHPYCDWVAEMPPNWTTLKGAECWQQVRDDLAKVEKACGAAHTYIGETGYNSGCPLESKSDSRLKAEREFVQAMLSDQRACKGQTDGTDAIPNFLFEFGDACPPAGCITGCGDPAQCNYDCCCKHKCSGAKKCAAGCPSCLGNGYFGLYHTPHYSTAGFPPEPKFDPTPSLLCPAQN
jgi:hypothetical protein